MSPTTLPPEVRAVLPEAVLSTVATSAAAATWVAALTGPTPGGGLDPQVASLRLPPATFLGAFTSSWGLEFEPTSLPVDAPSVLEVTSGRSSNQAMPWLAVTTPAGSYAVSVHWSGNWRLTVQPTSEAVEIEVALRPEGQRVLLAPGEQLSLPAVSVGWGPDLAEATAALVRHLGRAAPAGPLLTEWNHWWPYEDVEITEQVFLDNVAVAARVGLEVAVLDAGWFGPSEAGSEWFAERGDWHLTNAARFPHGLEWLAVRTREHGIDFGLWVEAEAVGLRASVAAERPELLALAADGSALGYVCLGSPAGRTHLLETVSGLVGRTGARWLKWDFNLDPGDGCGREDHGHGRDDGLLRHYRGLYAVMDQLRARHPDLVLEACASGGLRIDAGLAEHVHAFFLSDPDWTEHALCCLWGAAQQLPARQLLHWPQSEWRGEHRFQKVDYSGTLITDDAFDAKIRAALLHRFGISVRLTEMRPDLRERLAGHLALYRSAIRPLLEDGTLRPLTPQPLREERGHRQPAFQLSAGDTHVVAGFRLAPTGDWQPVRLLGLEPELTYAVRAVAGSRPGPATRHQGRELAAKGLLAVGATSSALWLVDPI